MTRYPGFRTYMEFERGFHGWLVFFFVTSCIGVCVSAFWLFRAGATLRLATATGSISLITIVILRIAIRAALLVAAIRGLHLFVHADSRTPTFWGAFLIASVILFIALDATTALQAVIVDGASFSVGFWPLVREGISPIVLQLVWLLYWIRSVRVRLTFGSNAFARGAESRSSSFARVT